MQLPTKEHIPARRKLPAVTSYLPSHRHTQRQLNKKETYIGRIFRILTPLLTYINPFRRLVYRRISSRMKDCPQNFTVASKLLFSASRSFFGQSFSLGHYLPKYQQARKVYCFYNLANHFSRRTHVDSPCMFCGFFRVSLCGIVNQLFNFSVTGFCKKYSFVFHDRLKVSLGRLLLLAFIPSK